MRYSIYAVARKNVITGRYAVTRNHFMSRTDKVGYGKQVDDNYTWRELTSSDLY